MPVLLEGGTESGGGMRSRRRGCGTSPNRRGETGADQSDAELYMLTVVRETMIAPRDSEKREFWTNATCTLERPTGAGS